MKVWVLAKFLSKREILTKTQKFFGKNFDV